MAAVCCELVDRHGYTCATLEEACAHVETARAWFVVFALATDAERNLVIAHGGTCIIVYESEMPPLADAWHDDTSEDYVVYLPPVAPTHAMDWAMRGLGLRLMRIGLGQD